MSGALQTVYQNQRSFSNRGAESFTTAGSYSWVAPVGVTKVSVVVVGAGGGGGLVCLITQTTSYGTVTANAGAIGTGAGVAPLAATLGQAGSVALLVLA